MNRLLLVALFLLIGSPARATDYDAMASKSWVLMTCAAFANGMPNGGAERDRLFEAGYTLGKQYLQAVFDGLLPEKNDEIPTWYEFPTKNADFTMGFIWARAFDVFEQSPEKPEDKFEWARGQFESLNCKYL
ncbi:hypothetical protein AB4Z34_33470 [Ensifer sp. 2YAB10]|uniref:hypothetical protein n=1 Tax=unclassified Ensifer TaxID=2633371 RepID=UPI003F913E53